MKALIVAVLAILLAGCADSGQGGAATAESGSSTMAVTNDPTEPGVAPEPGTRPSAGGDTPSTVTPAAPTPAEMEERRSQTPPTSTENTSSEPKEQGTQLSAEPTTGDDANPDAVNPRIR